MFPITQYSLHMTEHEALVLQESWLLQCATKQEIDLFLSKVVRFGRFYFKNTIFWSMYWDVNTICIDVSFRSFNWFDNDI